MIHIAQLENEKRIFFISDVHLPLQVSGHLTDSFRMNKVVAWLDYIQPQAAALFLLGDIFDFWFEYKYLIPKSAIRFQTKLWDFHIAQIPIYFFLGNHDAWAMDYLQQEFGVKIFKNPESIAVGKHSFFSGARGYN